MFVVFIAQNPITSVLSFYLAACLSARRSNLNEVLLAPQNERADLLFEPVAPDSGRREERNSSRSEVGLVFPFVGRWRGNTSVFNRLNVFFSTVLAPAPFLARAMRQGGTEPKQCTSSNAINQLAPWQRVCHGPCATASERLCCSCFSELIECCFKLRCLYFWNAHLKGGLKLLGRNSHAVVRFALARLSKDCIWITKLGPLNQQTIFQCQLVAQLPFGLGSCVPTMQKTRFPLVRD